jgi:hypothetical protein
VGRPHPHEDAVLIVGMLSAWPELFDLARERLAARFGPVAGESPLLDFDFTDYYAAEMGGGLKRRFLAFAGPFDAARLAEVKLWTNDLEREFVSPKRPVSRPLNLDPGYVDLNRLVLATTKDFPHRIYLGRGIYAEVTLQFAHGGFQAQPWTYRDYRTPAYHAWFRSVRDTLLARRRAAPA